jgi:hypothetical protein
VSDHHEPLVAPMDAARWNAVKRSVEAIDELRQIGQHSAALVMAGRLAIALAELAMDTADGPDFAQALLMHLVTEQRVPCLDHERDTRGLPDGA